VLGQYAVYLPGIYGGLHVTARAHGVEALEMLDEADGLPGSDEGDEIVEGRAAKDTQHDEPARAGHGAVPHGAGHSPLHTHPVQEQEQQHGSDEDGMTFERLIPATVDGNSKQQRSLDQDEDS